MLKTKTNENKSSIFAGFIYDKYRQRFQSTAVREALCTLEPAADIQGRLREYMLKKLSVCILIVVIGFSLSLLLWIKEEMQIKIVDNKIERNIYGNGEKDVSLTAKGQDGIYQLDLSVGERVYRESELMVILEDFIPKLEQTALAENETFDCIEYDLELVNALEDYPFDVEWRTDSEYVNSDGELVKTVVDKPAVTTLTAFISCEQFELRHEISCMIYSKAVQPPRSELIKSELEKLQSDTRENEFLILPSEIGEEKLSWSYKKGHMGIWFFMATPLLAIVIYFGTDRDLRKQVDERNEQLKLDYPEIVSELALLIGAGLTVTNAWNRVVKDYCVKKQETGKKRFAYEEMLLTVYEMESGVTQTKAFERFGRRCRVQSYNRLATMLSQNIRKGASKLALLLREEASYAFEERKHTARRMGEKAGTKLLMPMMMLLFMIMIVIMVPAFKTYF